MSRKASPAVIGAFVVGGIAVLVAGVIAIAGIRLFSHPQPFVVYFREPMNGLTVGTAVKFRGIQVGKVRDIRINLRRVQQAPYRIDIPVILEIDRKRLGQGAPADVDLAELASSLVQEGLRAQLALESLLTGVRYVELDMKPDTQMQLVGDPSIPYPEIPTVPSADEELVQAVRKIFAGLTEADVPGLVQAARAVTEGARVVVTAPELLRAVQRLDGVTANLNAAAVELGRTAREFGPGCEVGRSLASASQNAAAMAAQGADTTASVRRLLRPDSPFLAEVEAALLELNAAARSLRRLTDHLDRDPGAVLRGGAQ